MGVVELLLVIAVIGLAAYILVNAVPMPVVIQKALIGFAVLLIALIVIRQLGLDVAMPRVR